MAGHRTFFRPATGLFMAGYRTFFYRSPAIKKTGDWLKKVQSPDFFMAGGRVFFLTVTGLFLAGYRTFFYRSPAIKRSGDRTFFKPITGIYAGDRL